MKILRYRFRMITFVLVSALIVALCWNIQAFWFPSFFSGTESEIVSPLQSEDAQPESRPSDETLQPGKLPAEEEKTTPDPLYDTFGL